MRILLVTLVLALFALSSFADTEEEQFKAFIIKYGKSYTPAEYSSRFLIFKENLKYAAEQNARDPHAVFGVTKFSDLSPEEFRDQYLIKDLQSYTAPILKQAEIYSVDASEVTYPTTYDWNDKGMVTPVYNQGQCGSCWAFSTTEDIESAWAIAGNNLTRLSMQQIVDCDRTDSGCGGGNPPTAYDYVMKAGGLESYAEYPYKEFQGECKEEKSKIVASISTWRWITQDDNEKNMQDYVYNTGPPSVCVDARLWQSYTRGVITRNSGCGTSLDHCVQITGWLVVDGINSWNVRNSWGEDWADNKGYIYIEMGYNVCGIGQEVTSSVISS